MPSHKPEYIEKVMKVGKWYMENNLPATRIVAEHFGLSIPVTSNCINAYFRLNKIGMSEKKSNLKHV